MTKSISTKKCFFIYVCISILFFSGCSNSKIKRELLDEINVKIVDCNPGKQGGLLKLALGSGLLTFNPFVNAPADTLEITRLMFATLLDYDYEKKSPEETGLASSINVETDGKSYIIKLRKCLFSNGIPITSEDVIFSYKTCLLPEAESPLSDILIIDGKPPKLSTLNESELKIEFPISLPIDLARLIFARIPIISQSSFESSQEKDFKNIYNLKTPPDKIVCSGSFRVKLKSENDLTLMANEKYWKVDTEGTLLPYINEITYSLNLDHDTQSERFAKGEIDAVNYLTSDKFKTLQQNSNFTVSNQGPSLRVWTLILNGRTNPAKADLNKSKHFVLPEFRQALTQCINRNNLATLSENAKPAYNLISFGNKIWINNTVGDLYNLATAQKLLLVNHYTYTENELRDGLDQRVRFSITYPKDQLAEKIVKSISTDLDIIGIEVKANEEDYLKWWKILNKGVFDAILVEIQPDFPDPFFLQSYICGKKTWFAEGPIGNFDIRKGPCYEDSLVAFKNGIKEKIITNRKNFYNTFQQKWTEQCPSIYLISEDLIVGAQSNIKNIRLASVDPGATWNVEELYLN